MGLYYIYYLNIDRYKIVNAYQSSILLRIPRLMCAHFVAHHCKKMELVFLGSCHYKNSSTHIHNRAYIYIHNRAEYDDTDIDTDTKAVRRDANHSDGSTIDITSDFLRRVQLGNIELKQSKF